MASEWFYMIDGAKSGPVSSQKLKQLAASNRIHPKDLLQKCGMRTWVSASSVKGLFGQGPAPSPAMIPGQQAITQNVRSEVPAAASLRTPGNPKIQVGKKYQVLKAILAIFLFFFIINISLIPSRDGKEYLSILDLARNFIRFAKAKDAGVNKSDSKQEIEAALARAAEEMNKKLPTMIDEDTRLEALAAGPGQRLSFLYTLTKASSIDVSDAMLKEMMQASIREGACSAASTRQMLDKGVELVYQYTGNDGKTIGEIVIQPATCK
jgi:hypothetical protein